MSSAKKSDGLGGWTLKDETKFINGLGTFTGHEFQFQKHSVETLLKNYRAAVSKRHPNTMSFEKNLVLNLIDQRIEELRWQQA